MKKAPIIVLVALAFAAACQDNEDDPVAPPNVNVRPEPITDLSAEASGPDVVLVWTAPPDGETIELRAEPIAVAAYDVRRSSSRITEESWTTATFVDAPIPHSPGLAETTRVHGLGHGTFFFAVRSMDGDSAWSALSNQPSVTFAPPDGVAPEPIADLTVEAETATSVRLRWTVPLDSSGVVATYQGRFATVPITNANWRTTTPLPDPPDGRESGSMQTWIVPGFSIAGLYYFALRSIDDSGNVSRNSNVASITILPDRTPPQAIADLSVQSWESEAVTVGWTATGGDGNFGRAASYDFRWSTSEIIEETWEEATVFADPPIPAPAGVRETHTLHGLPSDTVVWVAVRARDESANASAISNVVSGRTAREGNPPGRILDLRAEDLTSESVRLRWTAPGDDGTVGQAARYDMRRASVVIDPSRIETYSVVPTPLPQTAGSSESVIIEDIVEGAVYFAIRAVDEAGNAGSVSNILRVEVPADNVPPLPVDDLAVVTTEASRIFLTWTAPLDPGNTTSASSYELRSATTPIHPDNWQLATLVSSLPTPAESGEREEFALTGLEPGTTYYVGIRSDDAAGNRSALSNIAIARTQNAASILVRPDGTGDYPTIQDALDAASPGATIELDDGTFRGDGNWDLVFPSTPVLLRSKSRDPEHCTIDCEAGEVLERVAVSPTAPLAAGTLLDGITFRGGRSQTGALHFRESAGVSIQRCRFVQNRVLEENQVAPAAVQLTSSQVEFEDCVFTENFGTSVVLDAASVMTGLRCRFLDNASTVTSAVHSIGGAVELVDCEIEQGCVESEDLPWDARCGSAVASIGGSIVIRGSRVEGTWARDMRSPVWLEGEAVARLYDTTGHEFAGLFADGFFRLRGGSLLTIERCRFFRIQGSGDWPLKKPGLFGCTERSTVEIRDSQIDPVGQRSSEFDAVIGHFVDSDLLMESTTSYGWASPFSGAQGAVWLFEGESNVSLRGSTFVQEPCPACLPSEVPTIRFRGRTLSVDRCIFYGNAVGSAIDAYYQTASITCTNSYGNVQTTPYGPIPGNWPDWMAELVGVDGNLEADPLFCDPAMFDFRLDPESPCAPFAGPDGQCDRMGALPVGCK